MIKKDLFHTGIKLRQLRDFRNYTLEWVSIELGIAKSTLSDWETGKVVPGQAVLIKAAELLYVDPGIFFTQDELLLELPREPAGKETGISVRNADHQLLERLFAHIHERDQRIEELFAKLLDKFGKG